MKLAILTVICVSLLGVWWFMAGGTPSMAAGPANASLGAKVDPANLKKAAFAGGCFWGTEASFRKVDGVVSTMVGYSGGTTENPTYEQVCTNTTGHAETVMITYDSTKISYAELLDAFWSCHDPTTVDRQGPDVGIQYRSVIFYQDDEQKKIAEASIKEVDDSHIFDGKIVTQLIPAAKFYPAEDYHQQYFEKQGTAETCHTGVAIVHTKLAAEAAARRKAAQPATQPASN